MGWLYSAICLSKIHICWRRVTGLSPPLKYFTEDSKAVLLLWIMYVFFCLVFVMPLCASVYLYLVVTCRERADLLALVSSIYLWVCHFPNGILGQVWSLIVSIPDLCILSYYTYSYIWAHSRAHIPNSLSKFRLAWTPGRFHFMNC